MFMKKNVANSRHFDKIIHRQILQSRLALVFLNISTVKIRHNLATIYEYLVSLWQSIYIVVVFTNLMHSLEDRNTIPKKWPGLTIEIDELL